MKRVGILTLALTGFVAAAACTSKTKLQDRPETITKLDNCNKALAEKTEKVKQLEAEIAGLQRDTAADQEVVITLKGDAFEIAGKGPNGRATPGPGGDADDAKLYEAFIDLVTKSRGSMKKCYEQVLKKNTGLQARTISMTVSASFASSGNYSRSKFDTSQSLGDTFDSCMKGIAQKWKLPAAPRAVTFQASVSLSPT